MGRPAGGRAQRGLVGQLEMREDREDNRRVGEECEDLHVPTTRWAEEREHLVDASEERGPSDARGVCGASRRSIDRGVRLDAGLIGRRSWAPGVGASGMPM